MTSIQTADGTIEMARRGAASSAGSIVLLHGIQGTALAWDGVVGHLQTDREIIRPNLRGRGGSFAPAHADAYSLTAFAHDLHGVLGAVNGPILLVGWSMGVLVALSYIRSFGLDALDGLILASGTAHPATDAVWFKGRTLSEIEVEAAERAKRLELAAFASPVAVAGAWNAVRKADLRDVLPRISVPTLVVHGSDDDQCPVDHGQAIAANVPGAGIEIWNGCGHNLMAEDARRFAGVIQGYVQHLAPGDMRFANQ